MNSYACVGKNGFSQNYMNYARGYRCSFDSTYNELVKDQYRLIDSIIFPLVFLARQSIELYLKLLFYEINNLWGENGEERLRTHNLEEIWDKIKKLLDTKIRIFETNDIKFVDACILKLKKIDNNGDVFRYPEDTNGNQHLSDTQLIDADYCYHKTSKLFDVLESFCDKIEDFQQHSHKECTNKLTPEDINNIAHMLPKIPWDNKPIIDGAKETIKEKHDISNSELSKAINIIKNNRKYSGILGMPRKLKFITLSKMSEFIDLCNKYILCESAVDDKLRLPIVCSVSDIQLHIKTMGEFGCNCIKNEITSFLRDLSNEELADLITMVKISREKYTNEQYESLLESNTKFIDLHNNRNQEEIQLVKYDKKILMRWLFGSLEEMGLCSLI